MGPIGFALGLESALDNCAHLESSLLWATWYLDDGTIVGKPSVVAEYLETLIPALKDIGLEVNLKKCQLWGPGLQLEPEATMMGLHDNHPICQIPVVPYDQKEGITVLGVPVDVPGSLTQGTEKWETATKTTISLLKHLRKLPDGQLRHCLLRHCLDACRVTHLMRSKCRTAAIESTSVLAGALREAVADVVGCSLTHCAWEQATIPISKGGLGVRDPEQCWPEARVAAIVGFHCRAATLVGLPENLATSHVPDTPEVIARLAQTLGPNHDQVS